VSPQALTLYEVVLRAVPPYQEVTVAEIASAVRDDYGNVTDRTIYRHLARLQRNRRIKRLGEMNAGVYIRAKPR